jgi:two-component system phosphate regulon response regulator PhoB
MPRAKIMIVEDDRSLADVLRYNLAQAGYDVHCAYDGRDAINQSRVKLPDLVLLDVMIPVVDGIEVSKQLRSQPQTRNTRIIMLTAKGEESDQIVGFSVGADDYVVKPFSVKLLMERIKALLRRSAADDQETADVIAAGRVLVDRVRHRVMVDDRPINLTPSEFRLLMTMIRQPGRAFARLELMEAALGDDANALERTIDVHIRSLRKKLGEAREHIETVRGVGYRFLEPVAQ